MLLPSVTFLITGNGWPIPRRAGSVAAMTSAPSAPVQQTISPRAWALMALLAAIWGGSFLSNRIALEEVGVLTTVAFRVAGAALFLWAYVVLRGLAVPRGARWPAVFLGMGVLNNVIPFTLIVWGQQYIPSGLAAIFNASTAIFAVLLAALIFADERLSVRKAVGVALGFAGVATAIGIGNLAALDLTSLGQLAIIGSSVSYAVASVFGRVFLKGIRPEVSAAGMLTGSALVMLPLALFAEGAPSFDYTAATWAALAYLAFAASALAYILYYFVLGLAGAGNLSLVTLLVVPVAIVLGGLVYEEALQPADYAGFALLAFGLLIIDGRIERMLPRRTRA